MKFTVLSIVLAVSSPAAFAEKKQSPDAGVFVSADGGTSAADPVAQSLLELLLGDTQAAAIPCCQTTPFFCNGSSTILSIPSVNQRNLPAVDPIHRMNKSNAGNWSWSSLGTWTPAEWPVDNVDVDEQHIANQGTHMMFTDTWGRVMHSLQEPNQCWTGRGILTDIMGKPGNFRQISLASFSSQLHVCATAQMADGSLNVYHTIRNSNGSWTGWGNVEGQVGERGNFVDVACASTNKTFDGTSTGVHLVGVTSDGRVWHTLRQTNGVWTPWIDVKVLAGEVGSFTKVDATCHPLGGISIAGVTTSGSVQVADRDEYGGSWTSFVNVLSYAGLPGSFWPITHVGYGLYKSKGQVAITAGGVNYGTIWHSERTDGWPPFTSWGNAQAASGYSASAPGHYFENLSANGRPMDPSNGPGCPTLP